MSVDPIRSAAARKVRKTGASPWNRGPMCDTPAGRKAHLRYLKNAKRRPSGRPEQGETCSSD